MEHEYLNAEQYQQQPIQSQYYGDDNFPELNEDYYWGEDSNNLLELFISDTLCDRGAVDVKQEPNINFDFPVVDEMIEQAAYSQGIKRQRNEISEFPILATSHFDNEPVIKQEIQHKDDAEKKFQFPMVVASFCSDILNGNSTLSIQTDIKTKYWRNERRVLSCFPLCNEYGDYFIYRSKGKCSEKPLPAHNPCKSSIEASWKLPKGSNHISVKHLWEGEHPWLRSFLVFRQLDDESQFIVGSSVTSEIIKSLSVSEGSFDIQGDSINITYSSKSWIYDQELSRKRRKITDMNTPLHVTQGVVVLKIAKDQYQVVANCISAPFQVESTKTLSRRLKTLVACKERGMEVLTKSFLDLLSIATFQFCGSVGIIASDDQTVPEKSGVFVWATKTCQEMLSYKPEELVGMVGWDIVHPTDREFLLQNTSASVDGFKGFTQFRRIDKKGNYIWTKYNFLSFPLEGSDVPGMLSIEYEFDHQSDITNLIKQSSEWSATNDKCIQSITELLDASKFAINNLQPKNEYDSKSDLTNNVTSIQNYLKSSYLQTCEELANFGLLNSRHTCNLGIATEDLKPLLDNQVSVTPESITTLKKVPYSAIDHSKYPNYEHLLELIENVDELFFSQLSKDGYFLWVSNSATKLYGYTKEEMVYKNTWHFTNKDDVPLLSKKTRAEGATRSVFRRVTKSGADLYVECFCLSTSEFNYVVERIVQSDHKEAKNRRFALEKCFRNLKTALQTQYNNIAAMRDMCHSQVQRRLNSVLLLLESSLEKSNATSSHLDLQPSDAFYESSLSDLLANVKFT